jgi:cell shape-determining protein MreD
MKVLKLISFFLVVFFLDQILAVVLGWPGNCIILPVVVFLAARGNFPISLLAGFSLGFLSDIVALREIPITSFFMLVSVLSLHLLSSKYLEFKSILSMILATLTLNILQIIFLILSFSESFSPFLIRPFIISSIVGVLVVILLKNIFKEKFFAE